MTESDDDPPQAEALMVAESCGWVRAERSEAQHSPTLAADSKTGADPPQAESSTVALQKKDVE